MISKKFPMNQFNLSYYSSCLFHQRNSNLPLPLASKFNNFLINFYFVQLSSSSGGFGFGGGAASLSSSRSESPASDRFAGKCSSLVSLHLKNIDSELEVNLSGSVASLKEQPCAANSAENENEKSAKVFAGKDARKIWRGSSSSVRRDRSSRRRRRKTSPEQLSLENSSVQASASVDGKTKSLSRLGVNTTADPNTSSSNESVYSNKYVKYSNHSIPIPTLFSNGKF